MGSVGARRARGVPAMPVPGPDELGIPREGFRRGEVFGTVAGPEPGERIPEGGKSALGRHAGAGQHDDVAGGAQPVGEIPQSLWSKHELT